jgi:hypothetical protein
MHLLINEKKPRKARTLRGFVVGRVQAQTPSLVFQRRRQL